ncbi:MAG: hypothetical protein LBI55_01415 [Oscillospiraceae bacterium]|nr:hypothetical protein [Oscillospiraceae bacterium]
MNSFERNKRNRDLNSKFNELDTERMGDSVSGGVMKLGYIPWQYDDGEYDDVPMDNYQSGNYQSYYNSPNDQYPQYNNQYYSDPSIQNFEQRKDYYGYYGY